MKKFIVVGLIGLTVMAFSSQVNAQPKMTFMASGYLEVVTFLQRNIVIGSNGNFATVLASPNRHRSRAQSLSGSWNRTQSYWEERGRLDFNFIMDKSLSATVGFEMDSGRMGEGNASTGIGTWNTDQTLIEIRYAYLTAGLPYIGIPIPMTVRAGIQPLAHRPSMFLYTEGPAITGTLNINPVMIGLTWAKPFEGKEAAADDVDVYGLTASAKVGTISVGGFVYYYNMNTYPLNTYTSTYGLTNAYTSDMWWFGVNSDGRLGPIDYNFDFVYDNGNVEFRRNTALATLAATAKKKVDYRGFATQLKITYPWEKFAFGALGMYASGADLKRTGRYGLPGESVEYGTGYTRKVGAYVVPPGSENYSIWGEAMVFNNNYITATATPATLTPTGQHPNAMTRGAIGGTWVAKIFASVSPVPWYKVTLQGMYIGDTTKHGNTLGDNFKNSRLENDSTIGWEVDLLNDIKIYNNLTWSVGGGILFAGDAFRQSTLSNARGSLPENPWIIATKLRYNF